MGEKQDTLDLCGAGSYSRRMGDVMNADLLSTDVVGPTEVADEFRHWLMMDTWTHEAAMWLIAGVIPHKIYDHMGYFLTNGRLLHNDQGEKDEKVRLIEKLEQLWQSNPDNPDSAPPSIFLKWAKEKKIEIDWLESAQRHGFLVRQEMVATDQAEKPLGSRERDTLLNIIGALVELIQTSKLGRDSETAVIKELLENYSDKPGIKERTLQEKFAAAKRSLRSN